MLFLRRMWTKRHSVFFSWLVSYISIMAIPLAVSILIYFQTTGVLENEIHQANISILKQVQQIMDNHIKNVERLSMEIAFNSQVNRLIYADPPMTALQRYDAYTITQNLKVYNTANNYIDQVYIYYKSIDFTVTANSMIDGRGFYDISGLGGELTYDQWKSIMDGYHLKEYMPIYKSAPSSGSKGVAQKIAFIQSIPIANRGMSEANIVIIINKSLFQEAVQNIKWLNDGTAFIIDSKGNILASNKPLDDTSYLKYGDLSEKSGLAFVTIKGKKAAVSYITSDINNWKYVSVIPSSVFWEKSDQVRKISTLSMVLCLLLGSVAAYLFLRKNYRPVSSIISALAGRAGVLFNERENEYSYIQEAISRTMNEKEHINQKLERQKRAFRDEFLQGLLYGKKSDIALEDHLSLLGIEIDSEYFAVMLFYIDSIEGLLPGAQFAAASGVMTSDSADEIKLAHFIIGNVVEELAGRKNHGLICRIDSNTACILNFRNDSVESAQEEMDEIAKKAQQFIIENFNMHFTVSISNVHLTLAGIPEAYREALQAMEYKMVIGLQEIIHFNSIKKSPGIRYYYPLEVEQQLMNQIRSGDFVRAGPVLDEVFDNNFKEGSMSALKARQLMSDIAGTIIKAVDSIAEYSENKAFTEYEFYEPLSEYKSLDVMKQNVRNTIEKLCREIREDRENRDHKSEFIDKVSDYINSSYSDINLSISSIAGEFDISPDYLSRLFREKTGQGILDFLNKVRLNKAKKLLAESEYTIKEIINKVGYNSSATFIRAFKRYEGITPGEYKNLGS